MFMVKGFANHVRFSSNVKDQVHPIGELSAYSITYAKDRGVYSLDDEDEIVLHTFRSSEDGVYTEVNQDWQEHIFTIINDVYKECLKGNKQWTDQINKYLITKHQSIANSFKVGKIVTDGQYTIPGWIQWKRNGHKSLIRIWFSDSVFRSTFDEYEITVIPPIEVVDNFFKPRREVEEYVRTQNDPVSMSARAQIARDYKPETIYLSLVYDWHDRNDPKYRLPTRWDILIYGEQGNNIDAIKDKIIDHILEHSTHDEEDWKKIFPDIFKRTEFIIIPRWDNYAIPNRNIIEGIYSPVVKYNDIIKIIRDYAHTKYGYTNEHIEKYATVMAHQYRSLQTLVISHPENRDNKLFITDEYPDYIAENTMTQDFNRMNSKTRLWSEGLTEMIIEAEKFDEYSTTPPRMTRLIREGKLYLVKSFNKINYLVAVKYNFYKVDDD